jgi:UTP:GlnB (protein PII) uridylyltransferase
LKNYSIQGKLDFDFSKQLTQKMGYEFSYERVKRIAEAARKLMDQKVQASWAFAAAIEDEVTLYGLSSSSEPPIGILNS